MSGALISSTARLTRGALGALPLVNVAEMSPLSKVGVPSAQWSSCRMTFLMHARLSRPQRRPASNLSNSHCLDAGRARDHRRTGRRSLLDFGSSRCCLPTLVPGFRCVAPPCRGGIRRRVLDTAHKGKGRLLDAMSVGDACEVCRAMPRIKANRRARRFSRAARCATPAGDGS